MDANSPNSPPMPNESLRQPLQDAISLFTALSIPYALVGGVAAMVYGRARFTEDVDFVASPLHEKFLADNPDVMRACRFDPACTWKLYHDSGIEIDIWKDEHADEITSRAVSMPFASQTLRIAEVHDLVAMKLRANRIQDDYDISEILRKTPLDEAVLRQRTTPEAFAHFLAIKKRSQG